MSHTRSSIKNLATAFAGQILGFVISFAARIIFLKYLNEEYLGLNGLFTNILTIFSLVELGVGPAMNFSLYKPLAEKNIRQVKSLMALYKKAYILIGCTIVVIGLAFTPFYTLLMDRVPDIEHLTVIYWLFALNTAVSYFYSYKRALIICDEKRYIATIYRYAFYFAVNVAQIIVLILTRNYILFLITQVIFTFLENVGVSIKADKMYPYLKEKNDEKIDKETSDEIKKNIKAMLMHKVGGVVITSTDNIVISKIVGLVEVGLYSNYHLITSALGIVIAQVFNSITASVGTLNASDNSEDKIRLEQSFDRIFFLNFWIYGFCSACLITLLNPFISLWLGEKYIFDMFTVAIIVIKFYVSGIRTTVLTYRDATGAFKFDRHKAIVEAVLNIVISIILAYKMGTAGVFLGTIISCIVASIWVEPYVLYKHVFKKNMKTYMFTLLGYTAVAVISAAGTYYLSEVIRIDNIYLCFVAKAIVCFVLPNLLYVALFFKTDNFRYFVQLIKKIILKICKK